MVDHSANQRSSSTISVIWHHGSERRRLDDNSMSRYWRCAHYKVATVLKVKEGGGGGATSHAIRYLKNKHNINIRDDESAVPILRPSIFVAAADLAGLTLASVATKGYKALVSIIDVERFRRALIMFFVICNIAF